MKYLQPFALWLFDLSPKIMFSYDYFYISYSLEYLFMFYNTFCMYVCLISKLKCTYSHYSDLRFYICSTILRSIQIYICMHKLLFKCKYFEIHIRCIFYIIFILHSYLMLISFSFPTSCNHIFLPWSLRFP